MHTPKRYLITSALPYANGPLHIGHIAGAYLPADIYVRYLRRQGRDVVFICGSDEHGAAITIQAKKEHTTPRAIIDKYHEINKAAFADLGISFDIYHRTSSPLHHETSQEFFLTLYKNGVFEEHESEQYYDAAFDQFLADRYIMGTCPVCGNDRAYGDQCERCGTSLSPSDLINPVSMLSNKPPQLRSTKHWYLPLNKFQGWLYEWIVEGKGRTEDWKKNVLGQCASWLKEGLQPRAITRDLDWGVPVPLPDARGKVLYVWLDAPIGYISATKQWALDNGTDWKPYWQDSETKLVHFIGKDNIVFHCLIFPCILKSHGEYILPTNVPANEFMNMEGDKMSTSRNWSIQLHQYVHDFPGKEDVLRYVLCANMPETKDSEFTWRDYQARNNNELVAIFGNFANRVMVLVHKFFDGKIPDVQDAFLQEQLIQEHRAQLQSIIQEAFIPSMESYRFRDAQSAMMDIARAGNKLLTDFEPWKLIKTDPERTAMVLRIGLECMYTLSVLAEPFLPFTAHKIYNMLQARPEAPGFGDGSLQLEAGAALGEPEHLFSKIEDAVIAERLAALEAIRKSRDEAANASGGTAGVKLESEPEKAQILYEDFAKLDLRTGFIVSAERIEGADKLLKLLVDLGNEQREIVSGIAKHFDPQELTGKKVIVLVNLQPRKMRGVESNGMLLMAESADGSLHFIQSETELSGLRIS
ncbi:MAG: methionine--tRNA ligase [Chitinophagales bacterium]